MASEPASDARVIAVSNSNSVTPSFINDAGRIVGQGTLNGVYENFILDLVSANHPPTAVAGADQTVDCQVLVTLNGSGSSDPDGDILNYEWSSGGYVLGTNAILSGYFGLGTNVVTLKVSDPCGASSLAAVTVIVQDTMAPTITAPAQIEAAAGVTCQAAVPNVLSLIAVNDNCTAQADLQVSQSPSAGAPVTVGDHPIQVTVTDLAGNVGSATIMLHVVDKTMPEIVSTRGSLTVAAGSDCQAIVPNVLGDVVASDNCTPANQLVLAQSPIPGTSVGKGQHTITVTVTDVAGNHNSAKISLSVVDQTAPVIASAPGALTVAVGNDCQGIVPDVLAGIVATDNCTPANQLLMSQTPAAGTSVAKGQYTIAVTVTDAAGNHSSANISLGVVDQTAPVIASAPGALTVAVGNDCHGFVPDVLAGIVAMDNCTPANQLIMNQTPAAGVSVAKGQYTIVVTVTDAAGNHSSTNVALSVLDQTAPVIVSVPGPLTVPVGNDCHGTVPNVLSGIVAADNCTPVNQLTLTQNPAAGTSIAKGQYVITVVVRDAAGNQSSAGVPLSVVDQTAPVISGATVNPSVLSPPNHQVVPVTVSVSATDNCDSAPVSKIVSITCNESVQPGEMTITGPLTASLAATRNGASGGRIYTLTIQCTDNSGNSSQTSVTVTVPQGNGKK